MATLIGTASSFGRPTRSTRVSSDTSIEVVRADRRRASTGFEGMLGLPAPRAESFITMKMNV
jgi:hypothetical protein